MAYDVKRKEKEIDDLLNRCAEAEDEGRTAYPGMNYEMGVKAGIEWLTGQRSDHPLEE